MCQTHRQRDLRNAKSRTCTSCHPERTTNGMTHWIAVCGESRKHGSDGSGGNSAQRQLTSCLPYNGAVHQACGGAERGQETAATHAGLQVATMAHPLKSTLCSDQSRSHPLRCTSFFLFRGPAIGANHKVSLAPKTGPQAKVYNGAIHQACGGQSDGREVKACKSRRLHPRRRSLSTQVAADYPFPLRSTLPFE